MDKNLLIYDDNLNALQDLHDASVDLCGWALAGWLAPLVRLPDALSYRLLSAGMLGMLAWTMALGLVEDVSEKGPRRPGDGA